MSIIVLLSPIHFFHFFLCKITIHKSKAIIFSLPREIVITSFFRKLTKVSKNNFKIDINEISDQLEMCKNEQRKSLFIKNKKFYPMLRLKHQDAPTVSLSLIILRVLKAIVTKQSNKSSRLVRFNL